MIDDSICVRWVYNKNNNNDDDDDGDVSHELERSQSQSHTGVICKWNHMGSVCCVVVWMVGVGARLRLVRASVSLAGYWGGSRRLLNIDLRAGSGLRPHRWTPPHLPTLRVPAATCRLSPYVTYNLACTSCVASTQVEFHTSYRGSKLSMGSRLILISWWICRWRRLCWFIWHVRILLKFGLYLRELCRVIYYT